MGEDIVQSLLGSVKMKGIIYCAINKQNGKRYIGQTIQDLKERQRKHFTTNCCPYFHNAILKYGKDSFEWKIIDNGIQGEDLDRKEKFWISFFNSDKVEKGYNLTSGGQGGAFLSKEDTKKARDIFIEKYGKKYNIKRKGQNIRCIETQKIFKNAAEASRVMKIHHGHITSAANGKLKTAGGYHWEWCLELSFFPNALYCQELDKIFLSFYEAQRENNFSNVKLGRKFKESKKIFTYAGYTFEKINYQE